MLPRAFRPQFVMADFPLMLRDWSRAWNSALHLSDDCNEDETVALPAVRRTRK